MCDPKECSVKYCKFYENGCICDKRKECSVTGECPYIDNPNHEK